MSEEDIIKEFICSDNFIIINDYITKPYEETIKEQDKEIERLNNIKQDLLYVLSQLDGYLDKGWTIDLNFTDIREKYKKDIEDYENWY